MIAPAVGDWWSEPQALAERPREIERQQAELCEFYRQETEQQ